MTEEPKSPQITYDPDFLLKGVTVEELLQLDGKQLQIFDQGGVFPVKKIDDTTITIGKIYTILIHPETGQLYIDNNSDGHVDKKAAVIIVDLIRLNRKGLRTDLEPLWNEDRNQSSYEYDECANEILNTFDNIMSWLGQQVKRAMNETNFGESEHDTVKISFNDKDKSARSVIDLNRIPKR